jgi:hypothetical protein
VEVGNREQFGLARRHPLACCRALAVPVENLIWLAVDGESGDAVV